MTSFSPGEMAGEMRFGGFKEFTVTNAVIGVGTKGHVEEGTQQLGSFALHQQAAGVVAQIMLPPLVFLAVAE
jgi:hypothetical protein